MKASQTELETELNRLIANPATRAWERKLLESAKQDSTQLSSFNQAINRLEASLRPLAIRNNLTPDVSDFYSKITGKPEQAAKFDLSQHYAVDYENVERAVFAGGCFWCMVEPFDTRPGILSVVSGYTGGNYDNPTYEAVSGHYTGHVEAVEIIFDSRLISYDQLIAIYWTLIDPTDNLGQVNDRGEQYKPIIFVNSEHQRQVAKQSKNQVITSKRYKKPIVVEVKPLGKFWPAENFHQDFYKKNRRRYQRIEHARRQYLKLQQLRGWLRSKF